MAGSPLRVVVGQEDESRACTLHAYTPRPQVTVRLGEVAELLADAVRSDRTWLYDFQDDELTVSSDLYEVLQAYRRLPRPRG
jgi:hypothetical protein